LPEHERPREKLIERGAVALTDHELLAVLIGKGSRRHDAITLAKKMIPVIDEKGTKLKESVLKLPPIWSRISGIT